MPICPRCHGYYTREPCPTCGPKREVKHVNVIDESMSTSEILQKGEELLHLREENQRLRDKLTEKSSGQENLEKEIKELQRANKYQLEELEGLKNQVSQLTEENQLIKAQVEMLKKEKANLEQELIDLQKSSLE